MKECKANKNLISDPPTSQANLEKMIKEVKSTEVQLESKIKTELKYYMDHHQDKESRKNNIIILRLEEQSGENENEKIEKDRQNVKKLLEVTNPELRAEIDNILKNKKTFRLGRFYKAGNKPRPIKIELPDEEIKRDIFRGCKNLKNSDFNHVSIQNDLTREEQEQNFKLRQELKERKQKGEKVCIFNNSIILESDQPRNKAPTSSPK